MSKEFEIRNLGPCTVPSPISRRFFATDDVRVRVDATTATHGDTDPESMEKAGPRRSLFFQPDGVRAAVVTCGGLCPGLNDVIRGLTMVLWHRYGVRTIFGVRYGYQGLTSFEEIPPLKLAPEEVEDIHQDGGTILGSSRGGQDTGELVDTLVANGINMLFTLGGDGTQRGARDIADEVERRGLPIAVVGIPKTIDNDVSFTDRTFGFVTAVSACETPIACAHMEAKGIYNGIGLVRLMGRHSGFVAAYATLASSDVNVLLVPEVPFSLDKLMACMKERLAHKPHAVVVVAEGAGQDLVSRGGADASGNKNLGDIGVFLNRAFKEKLGIAPWQASVKYIDPSYTIRSIRANSADSVFCFQLAESAVHAAMAGRTAMVVGQWNGRFVHVPLEKAVGARKQIDPNGALWQSVLENTGQPELG